MRGAGSRTRREVTPRWQAHDSPVRVRRQMLNRRATPMADAAYVAVDLGAESGRVIVGTLRRERVELEQVHRFANVPVRTPEGLHWNVLGLYDEILDGLRAAARLGGARIAGIGIDSWAVDYGLIDAGGRLLGIPYHYRDARTDGVREEVAQVVAPREQYA